MNTNRRSFIAASAASAVAVAIPASAATRNERWQRAKARFLNSHQRMEAAGRAHTAMEREQSAFEAEAPTRELIYTNEGFRISNAGGDFTVHPKRERFVLSRTTIRLAPQDLKATPEFADFEADLAAWRDRWHAQDELRGWGRIELAWNDALDRQCEAWRAMIECPVSTAADMAEKARLAKIDRFGDESDLRALLDALQADMARLQN